MSGKRRWTKEEIRKLYQYAEQCSQAEAARRLRRTRSSLQNKVSELDIKWFQGFASIQDIATAAGCTKRQSRDAVRKNYPNGVPGYGNGSGFRARVPIEEAEWIVKELRKKYRRKLDV